jgi:hypothetical protein
MDLASAAKPYTGADMYVSRQVDSPAGLEINDGMRIRRPEFGFMSKHAVFSDKYRRLLAAMNVCLLDGGVLPDLNT